MNIRRIFIANRGEIAARVIRTCRRLGITSVLGASDADLDSAPARLADRVERIGPARSADSYLNIEAVLAAALRSGADAVHPGYGFLSENAAFARTVRAQGLAFIGPSEANLHAVGDKLTARAHALEAGLPLAPGGSVEDVAQAERLAREIGFPLLVKAVGGGGGRGMKRIDGPEQLSEQTTLAMAEAGAAFGDPRVYLERFVASGRHVEAQVLGDGARVIHIGDRDCSVQRRFQKLVEEAPAPDLPDDVREALRAAAVRFAERLNYVGLGTVEFLYDRERRDFYFLEMNARIQVEHPVTEAIAGLDLVEEQIYVAEGRPLRWRQQDIRFHGHALECRLNAEDWAHDFRPSPGTLTAARFPVGPCVRVDTHMEPGARVPPFYDSLMAKIVVTGADRAEALARMKAALALVETPGVATNRDLHLNLMGAPEFAAGGVDTAFLPRWLEAR